MKIKHITNENIDQRIRAIEARAEQNIYQANRERDYALATFTAKIEDALRAQFADLPEDISDEKFETTTEEVLMIRLKEVQDRLRRLGVNI